MDFEEDDKNMSSAFDDLTSGIKDIGDNIMNVGNEFGENIKKMGNEVTENIKNVVTEGATNAFENIKEKTSDFDVKMPPFLNNIDPFRRNVLKIAIVIFLVFNLIVFIMFKMGENTMNFFSNPSPCPEGWTLDSEGNCNGPKKSCSGATGDIEKILKGSTPEQIKTLVRDCGFVWDGYSNNPDFMNEPL